MNTWIVAAVDVAVPVALIVALAVTNTRHRRSARSEIAFWLIAVAYIALMLVFTVVGASSVDSNHGYGLIGAIVWALPASAIGAVLHVGLAWPMGVLMDPKMTAIFAAALACWAAANPFLARRVRQRIREGRQVKD